MSNKQIVLIGNVASGKSTLSQYLIENLPLKFVPADELYKTNPFFQNAVSDRARWSLASDLWFLKERAAMTKATETDLQTSHVLIDSGLLMSYVYSSSRVSQGYFTNDEWQLFEAYFQLLTKQIRQPDLVIYLDAPVEFLRERIIERGRDFEIKGHSLEYLSGLAEGLNQLEKQLVADSIPVLKYQVDSPSFTMEQVTDELNERLEG